MLNYILVLLKIILKIFSVSETFFVKCKHEITALFTF